MHLLQEGDSDIEVLISQAEGLVERRSSEALPLAEKIMTLALAKGHPKYYAQAKYILAFYHCLVVNDYDKAIVYCEEVLNSLSEEDIAESIHKIYMTLGNSYHLKGDVFSAEQCYMKGLRKLENKKELTTGEKGFLASFYYNLSLLLSDSQLNISSEEYLENAIGIYKELNNSFKLSKSYVAYAGVFEKKKEYSKAIDILYKSLEIDEKLNDPYSIALSKANLGILHLRIEENQRALDYINDAFNYYESNQMKYETAMVKMNYAEALYAIGKRQEAIANLFESEKLFLTLDNKQELNRVYEMLSDQLRETGHFEQALDYQRKYADGLKYFFDIEKTNSLTRAKKEFETEQKEKEAAMLREKNEEINHYVNKLEQSNNQLKQFAHVASHDLREPLRMISSYMEILQKTMNGQLNSQQEEFMKFVIDGAKRMDQLIIDLLRLAKIDANPQLEEVDLNVVVAEIKMNIGKLLEEKGAVVLCPELPKITADRTMVIQLFQNLISNGIKYNESLTPTILIKFRKLNENIELTIADNGIGIPENLRERAFQIFHRLPTKKEYSGTGIGLSICKRVVESMNGTITINDNPGGGSVFAITLPTEIICNNIKSISILGGAHYSHRA